MLGETDENWAACVERTLELEPDSVTIYQMELPYNTTISSDLLKNRPVRRAGGEVVDQAALGGGGVRGARACRVSRRQRVHRGEGPAKTRFLYRDRLWQGADLVGLGVASFGHINGVHLQNVDTWEKYSDAIERGELPLGRAYRPTDEERMIREFVLQLKRGSVRPAYFQDKVRRRRARAFSRSARLARRGRTSWRRLATSGSRSPGRVAAGRRLLPRFFLPQHVGIRYT